MAELIIDVTLRRGQCWCHLPAHLAKQIAPHRATCPYLMKWDTISLMLAPGDRTWLLWNVRTYVWAEPEMRLRPRRARRVPQST
jgi:hypothetical protein